MAGPSPFPKGRSEKESMRSRNKKIAVALNVFVIALALTFVCGPLLPWSPFKPGYQLTQYGNADVFSQSANQQVRDYADIDAMMREAEAFHRMKFLRRVKVIACKSWGDCERALPWLNVKVLGGITLAVGDVIYITPRLQERHLSVEEFLRHELSHALLSQHTAVRKSLSITEQGWFSEGLAVSFARQKAYLSEAEFLEKAYTTDLAKFIDPAKMDRFSPEWDARFAYTAQRYFIEYLKRRFGGDRFQEFTIQYLDDPDNYLRLFSRIFQISFSQAIKEFSEAQVS
jgi:hypothetical protein